MEILQEELSFNVRGSAVGTPPFYNFVMMRGVDGYYMDAFVDYNLIF